MNNNETTGSPYYSGPPQLPDPEVYRRMNAEAAARMERMQEEQQARAEKRGRMLRAVKDERYMMVTVFCILLGLLFADVNFRAGGGIGSLLAFAALEGIVFYCYRTRSAASAGGAKLLALPVMLLAVSFALFRDSDGTFIPYMTAIILVALQVILLSGTGAEEIFGPEMVREVFVRIIARPLASIALVPASLKTEKGAGTMRRKNLLYVAIGVLVAIPFLAILLVLFLSADGIFEQGYQNLIETLKIDITPQRVFFDLFFGLAIAFFVAAVLLRNAVDRDQTIGKAKEVRINTVAATTFAVVLDLLLLVFAAVQLRYIIFFSENTGVVHPLIEEIGYAEYARRGFFELSWASGIVFAVAVAVLSLTRDARGKSPASVRIPVLLMCLFNGVIAVASARRMLLYIEAHGLSVKRVSTLFGILVILASLVWLALKCLLPRMKALKMIGSTIVVLVVLFSFFNVDRAVSAYNTERYISGELQPDLDYFHQTSYTTAPELAALKEAAARDPEGPLAPYAGEIDAALRYQSEWFEGRALWAYTLDDIRVGRALAAALTTADGA